MRHANHGSYEQLSDADDYQDNGHNARTNDYDDPYEDNGHGNPRRRF